MTLSTGVLRFALAGAEHRLAPVWRRPWSQSILYALYFVQVAIIKLAGDE